MIIDPNNDGIDHINIYSKGKTELGRQLTNFSHHKIQLPEHGTFESIEGFWYWLGVPEDNLHRNLLRTVYGWEAKKLGKEILSKCTGRTDAPFFKTEIIKALLCKVSQHNEIYNNLVESTLPFEHYYVYYGKVQSAGDSSKWLCEVWNTIRNTVKLGLND